ncbi:LacI family DNA-binding transcriptional regulator [Bifidobacterium sp. LC6]|uniref:LacI family DNA-binding transcriptional regulator n=1 Tax=Bifidobacterium colobi TaxID=2809026 RepID=A0ABS5UV86_9BIFI|nr:LacI family DNA-binding transcriptional regulator [Bifidobacterium colobi]MBT1174343.1 LacI family DNA-binding transcriptional regulator [Bifidobacterium colobi]
MTATKNKVTIRDVARLAGVSYGTVSRYLNGNEHVSERAAQRIAQAIEESQYTPNNAARSLAQQRTSTIAFIVQVESIFTLLQASTTAAMAEANQILGDAGYQMVTLIANSDDSTHRIAQLVHSDFADGYLLFSLSEDDSLAKIFRTAHRPVVLSEASDRSTDVSYPAVDFANADGQRDITRFLLDRGKTRLAYVCGPGYSPSSSKRLQGFKQAMGSRYDDNRVYYADDWEITSGEMAAAAFEPILHDLDGIVCANDNIAIGVINQLHRMGYRVPEDIAVTGFDDSPIATMMDPKLTTVRQDSWMHGRAMSQLLLSMLRGETVGPHTVTLLPTEIVTRQSA